MVGVAGSMMTAYHRLGWQIFRQDAQILAWSKAAAVLAEQALNDPQQRADWLVCEGTWFVGVDALPNGADGAISGVPLQGQVMDVLRDMNLPVTDLHRAQVSVVWPGYPRPREGESNGAFRYRQKRDSAHVDGIRPIGPARRRMLREPHAYILGLPLNDAAAEASPLVVWERSHDVIRAALAQAYDGIDPAHWGTTDITDIYQAARAQVFETCRRVTVHTQPGQAVLVHRLALHGVAPWAAKGVAPQGRRIAYFRPELPNWSDWIAAP